MKVKGKRHLKRRLKLRKSITHYETMLGHSKVFDMPGRIARRKP